MNLREEAYAYLVKNGPSTLSTIALALCVSSWRLFEDMLDDLVILGIISVEFDSLVMDKRYTALDPRDIVKRKL